MQQEKFIELLNHPEKLDKSSAEQLKQLVAQHPYSQPLRILLAKNHQLLNRPEFEQTVNLAATYAIDRRQFQQFISGKSREKTIDLPSVKIPKTSPQTEKGNRFGKWLSALFAKRNVPPTSSEPEIPQLDKAKPEQTVSLDSNQPDGQTIKDWTKETAKQAGKHDELIDKFLKEEPRILPKKEFVSEENLAEKNMLSPEDMGTETLAMVFQKQGLHERALDIYQKLSLKYPEKSSYFAEKINSIKNEINLKK
jgi:hypothetical protein